MRERRRVEIKRRKKEKMQTRARVNADFCRNRFTEFIVNISARRENRSLRIKSTPSGPAVRFIRPAVRRSLSLFFPRISDRAGRQLIFRTFARADDKKNDDEGGNTFGAVCTEAPRSRMRSKKRRRRRANRRGSRRGGVRRKSEDERGR